VTEPFPFAALPAIARRDLDGAAHVHAFLRARPIVDRLADAVADLVGETVTISIRRVTAAGRQASTRDAIAVLLDVLDAEVLVEAEAPLAATMIAKALKLRAPRVVDAARPQAAFFGAFAAIIHACARRAGGAPLRVLSAAPAADLTREFSTTAALTVRIGPDVFDARVHLPPLPREPTTFSRAALEAMGDTPLSLPLVAATCLATRADLTLREGDVFVVPELPHRGAEALTGPIVFVAPRAEKGLEGTLADGGRLVIRTERWVSQPWDSTAQMDSTATLEALEDAPVVVRVELGAIELAAREWAALGPGDVITLGRKIGDPAILRVGGVEVARGELVQVEGEYGVRILGGAGAAGQSR
jgi:flagellar motor switch/type III secretory pathway protein FliN